MITTENNHYSTSDTALATYLICAGFKLGTIDYSQPRYEFIFPNEYEENDLEKIAQHSHLYITGKARVDPATYKRIDRKLTRIIKNNLQWWGV